MKTLNKMLNKKTIFIGFLLMFVLTNGFIQTNAQDLSISDSNITSFEQCAGAGYPVTLSYPRQCRTPDNRVFVEGVVPPVAPSPAPTPTCSQISLNVQVDENEYKQGETLTGHIAINNNVGQKVPLDLSLGLYKKSQDKHGKDKWVLFWQRSAKLNISEGTKTISLDKAFTFSPTIPFQDFVLGKWKLKFEGRYASQTGTKSLGATLKSIITGKSTDSGTITSTESTECQWQDEDEFNIHKEKEEPPKTECGNNVCEAGEEGKCPEDCGSVGEIKNPFGIAFGTNHAFKLYGQNSLKFIREAGATDFGIHIFWSSIEPINDNYDWRMIDNYISQIQPEDNAYIVVQTDGWCTEDGNGFKGSPLLEKCEKEYREFIKNLAERTNGKIQYWQRDIEPATSEHWPEHRAEEYVKLQKIFYEEVKSIIPDSQIGGLGLAGRSLSSAQKDFVKYFFQNSESYFDYLDIHLYKDKYSISEGISEINLLMNYDKPLIVKEFGGPTSFEYSKEYNELLSQLKICDSDMQCVYDWVFENFDALDPKMQIFTLPASHEQNEKRDRIQCRDMTQRHLITLEHGAQKVFQWNLIAPWDPSYGPHLIFGKMRLLDEKHNKQHSFFCYQRMTDKLFGITSVKRIPHSNSEVYFYKIRKSNEVIYVVWRHEAGKDSYDEDTLPKKSITLNVDLSGNVKVTDVFGNIYTKTVNNGQMTLDVDNTPLYIEEQ